MADEENWPLIPQPDRKLASDRSTGNRIVEEMVREVFSLHQAGYARELITRMCEASDFSVRSQAHSSLRRMGPTFEGWMEGLREAIYSKDGWVRVHASEVLSCFNCLPHDVIPVLITVVEASADSGNFDWGQMACGALGNYSPIPNEFTDWLVEALISVLKATSFTNYAALPVAQFHFRGLAVRLLGRLGPQASAALPTLAPLLVFRGKPPVGDPLFEDYKVAAQKIDPSIHSADDAIVVSLRAHSGIVDVYEPSLFSLYRSVAERGFPEAQCFMGHCYRDGNGVPQDDAEAANWYRKAAEQGNAEGEYHLGVSFDCGRGVPKEHSEAVYWYRKAAEKDSVNAQANLAYALFNGRGTVKDVNEAVHWYQLAAKGGNALAIHNLAVCFDEGVGVPQNSVKATQLYRTCAERGYRVSQFNLGLCFRDGKGVSTDPSQAYSWFRLAADQGHERAANEAAALAASMAPPEFQIAHALYCELKEKLDTGV